MINKSRRRLIQVSALLPCLFKLGIINARANKTINTDLLNAQTIEEVFELLKITSTAKLAKTSKKIELIHPEIYENGTQTPIKIISNIVNTQKIALLVVRNPVVFAVEFELDKKVIPTIEFYIRVSRLTDLYALVFANDSWYYKTSEITVIRAGCE